MGLFEQLYPELSGQVPTPTQPGVVKPIFNQTDQLDPNVGYVQPTDQSEGKATQISGPRPSREQFYPMIDEVATKHGLPSSLIHGVVQTESNYNPYALSSAGAYGLMQLMPGTAKDLNVDPASPYQNLMGGTKYLKDLVDRYGDLRTALAAYNIGPGNLDAGKFLDQGQTYADTVLRNAGIPSQGGPLGSQTMLSKASEFLGFDQAENTARNPLGNLGLLGDYLLGNKGSGGFWGSVSDAAGDTGQIISDLISKSISQVPSGLGMANAVVNSILKEPEQDRLGTDVNKNRLARDIGEIVTNLQIMPKFFVGGAALSGLGIIAQDLYGPIADEKTSLVKQIFEKAMSAGTAAPTTVESEILLNTIGETIKFVTEPIEKFVKDVITPLREVFRPGKEFEKGSLAQTLAGGPVESVPFDGGVINLRTGLLGGLKTPEYIEPKKLVMEDLALKQAQEKYDAGTQAWIDFVSNGLTVYAFHKSGELGGKYKNVLDWYKESKAPKNVFGEPILTARQKKLAVVYDAYMQNRAAEYSDKLYNDALTRKGPENQQAQEALDRTKSISSLTDEMISKYKDLTGREMSPDQVKALRTELWPLVDKLGEQLRTGVVPLPSEYKAGRNYGLNLETELVTKLDGTGLDKTEATNLQAKLRGEGLESTVVEIIKDGQKEYHLKVDRNRGTLLARENAQAQGPGKEGGLTPVGPKSEGTPEVNVRLTPEQIQRAKDIASGRVEPTPVEQPKRLSNLTVEQQDGRITLNNGNGWVNKGKAEAHQKSLANKGIITKLEQNPQNGWYYLRREGKPTTPTKMSIWDVTQKEERPATTSPKEPGPLEPSGPSVIGAESPKATVDVPTNSVQNLDRDVVKHIQTDSGDYGVRNDGLIGTGAGIEFPDKDSLGRAQEALRRSGTETSEVLVDGKRWLKQVGARERSWNVNEPEGAKPAEQYPAGTWQRLNLLEGKKATTSFVASGLVDVGGGETGRLIMKEGLGGVSEPFSNKQSAIAFKSQLKKNFGIEGKTEVVAKDGGFAIKVSGNEVINRGPQIRNSGGTTLMVSFGLPISVGDIKKAGEAIKWVGELFGDATSLIKNGKVSEMLQPLAHMVPTSINTMSIKRELNLNLDQRNLNLFNQHLHKAINLDADVTSIKDSTKVVLTLAKDGGATPKQIAALKANIQNRLANREHVANMLYGEKFSALDPKKREQVTDEINRQTLAENDAPIMETWINLANAGVSPKEAADRISGFYMELAKDQSNFKMTRPPKGTTHYRDIIDSIKEKGFIEDPTTEIVPNRVRVVDEFNLNTGSDPFDVITLERASQKDTYVSSMLNKTRGDLKYKILMHFVYENGKRMIGDPGGMTTAGRSRKGLHQMSFLLGAGADSPADIGAITRSQMVSGFQGVLWKPEDFNHNVTALALRNMQFVNRALKGRDVKLNLETGNYEIAGKEVTLAEANDHFKKVLLDRMLPDNFWMDEYAIGMTQLKNGLLTSALNEALINGRGDLIEKALADNKVGKSQQGVTYFYSSFGIPDPIAAFKAVRNVIKSTWIADRESAGAVISKLIELGASKAQLRDWGVTDLINKMGGSKNKTVLVAEMDKMYEQMKQEARAKKIKMTWKDDQSRIGQPGEDGSPIVVARTRETNNGTKLESLGITAKLVKALFEAEKWVPSSGSQSVMGEVNKFAPSIWSQTGFDKSGVVWDHIGREFQKAEVMKRDMILKERGIVDEIAKGMSEESLKNVGLNLYAVQPDIMLRLEQVHGITAKDIPKMNPQEQALFDYFQKRMPEWYNELNGMRVKTGLLPFKKEMNYFTLIQSLSWAEKMKRAVNPLWATQEQLGSLYNDYISMAAKEAPFRFKKQRAIMKSYEIDMDPLSVYDKYVTAAAGHLYNTPIIAKISEIVDKPLPRPDGQGSFKLREHNEGVAAELDMLRKFMVGDYAPDSISGRLLQKFTTNLTAAMIGYNFNTFLTQLSAVAPAMLKMGMRPVLDGAYDLLQGSGTEAGKAIKDSHVIRARTMDVMFDGWSKWADRGGWLKKATVFPLRAGFDAIKWADAVTAETVWRGAFNYGRDVLNLKDVELRNYADDIVTKTQGSGIKSDISPFQRTAMGRALTPMQSFVINDLNLLLRDGLRSDASLHGGGERSALKKMFTYMAVSSLMGQVYTVAGFSNPFGSPLTEGLRTYYDERERKRSTKAEAYIATAKQVVKEFAQAVPIISGASRTGGTVLGPVLGTLKDAFTLDRKIPTTAKEFILGTKGPDQASVYDLITRAGGVQGANQAKKMYRAYITSKENRATPARTFVDTALGRSVKKKFLK